MDAIETLKIISGRTLDVDEKWYACFIDWQKRCDRVNWTELVKILKLTGIEWRERKLIRILCMDQCVRLKLDQRETRKVKIGGGVRQG
jgi:hypothetical protein